MKLIILLAFLAIFISLGSALFSLTRKRGDADRGVVKALTWRIGISIALFLFILFAFAMGWASPHGLRG